MSPRQEAYSYLRIQFLTNDVAVVRTTVLAFGKNKGVRALTPGQVCLFLYDEGRDSVIKEYYLIDSGEIVHVFRVV